MQKDLLERARQMRKDRTYDAATIEDLEKGLVENPGWYRAGWDGDDATEAAVKERTNATIRVIPLEGSEPGDRKDLISGMPAKYTVIYARAY